MTELGVGLLAEILEEAAGSFVPNELAYLALTSKIWRGSGTRGGARC